MHTAESSVESFFERIDNAQADVREWLRLHDAEQSRQVKQNLDVSRKDLGVIKDNMTKMLSYCRQATQIEELHDSLKSDERRKLLSWLSTINYRAHHKAMGVGFLPNSGRWLLENEAFLNWRESSVPSILWLHGIPGSGKSRLVYSVIEHIRQENDTSESPAPLALFYCLRAEGATERADPDEILRCILKQLSCKTANLPIREPVASWYKEKNQEAEDDGSELDRLNVKECVKLIIDLLEENPATIVIDALDECNPQRRHELLSALDNIIQESANLVKVFVSSRDDKDIVYHLERSQNIYINASDNGEDIERYITSEVQKAISDKRLLCGDVPEFLQEEIIETLTEGAQGMRVACQVLLRLQPWLISCRFRWVSLQIENLCDPERMKHEKDVFAELGRLPQTLKDSYAIVYERIRTSGGWSRTIAHRVICWLLCARRTLKPCDFITAVSVDLNGQRSEITPRDLLNICCNLVILDDVLDIFRFAHLSVQEYFEAQSEYDRLKINKVALARCLQIFTTSTNPNPGCNFDIYAAGNWLHHGRYHQEGIIEFCFDEFQVSQAFIAWESFVRCLGKDCEGDDLATITEVSELLCSPPTPLLMACHYSWAAVLDYIKKIPDVNWDQFDASESVNPLLIAVGSENFDLAKQIIRQGADVNAVRGDGDPLIMIWSRIHDLTSFLGFLKHDKLPAQLRFLIENGADVNAVDRTGRTTLASLGVREARYNIKQAQILLSVNPDLDVVDHHGETALQILLRGKGDFYHGVETLLGAMSDFNRLAAYKDDLICFVARYGCHGTVESAIKFLLGLDQTAFQTYVSTALHYAAWNGDLTLVDLLLATDEIDNDHMLISAGAKAQKVQKILKLVAMKGVKMETVGTYPLHCRDKYSTLSKRSPLQSAIIGKYHDVARVLLAAGVDCNSDMIDEGTVLHQAVRSKDVETVSILVEAGCDVDATDSSDRTALHCAVRALSVEIVRILVEAGCNIDVLDKRGYSALHAVVYSRSSAPHSAATLQEVEIMNTLIKAGCTLDTVERTRHHTALHDAVTAQNVEIVRILVEAGCNADAVDKQGRAIVHAAAYSETAEIIQVLQEAGCNMDARDSDGRTAEDITNQLEWSRQNTWEYWR